MPGTTYLRKRHKMRDAQFAELVHLVQEHSVAEALAGHVVARG